MELLINFIFRETRYSAGVHFALRDDPGYLFVDLLDMELKSEFGNEITIKTDGDKVLPRKDDYPALVALRHAMFASIKSSRIFHLEKIRARHSVKGQQK